MYVRKTVAALTSVLAVGVCIFITYISRDIDLGSLLLNLAFLGVMAVTLLAALLFGLFRLDGISRDLGLAAEGLRSGAQNGSEAAKDTLFRHPFLSNCYEEYVKMARSNPDGSCDIQDYINEEGIDTYIHRGLIELVPDILTSLGILGTFIGLVLGLRGFDPSGFEEMAESVTPLIDGIKVAFVTSIYGLSLSLPFSFQMRSSLSDLSSKLEDFLEAFYLHVQPSHEVASAARMLEQKKSQEELTNDLTKVFVEHMSKSFEQTLSPAFARMTDSIGHVVDSFTASQEQAVARICQTILADMRSELSSSFLQITETVAKLEQSQAGYMDFMDRSLHRMQQSFASLQKQMAESGQYSSDSIARLTKAQEEAFRISQEQKDTYQDYIRFMYHSIEQFSQVWEVNNARLQAYTDEISKMGPVQSSRDIRRDLEELSRQLSSVQRSLADQALPQDTQTEEMLNRILCRLDELEEIASAPALFRRKKQR